MVETIIGMDQLNRRLTALSSPAIGPKIMSRLGLSTVREAKLLVRRKTGNLGRSIHISDLTPTSVRIVAGARYAPFVEFGTRPHEITPKAGKALRWAATPAGRRLTGSPRAAALRGGLGGVVFATRVHHPGTRAYPFLLPGARLAVTKSGIAGIVVEEWDAAA